MTFNLSPLLNDVIIPLATPIVSAGALWLFYKIAQLLHFHIQEGQRALFEKAIANGIAFARTRIPGNIAVNGVSSPPVVNTIIGYVLSTAPGAVKSLGLDKDAEALANAITARLPSA